MIFGFSENFLRKAALFSAVVLSLFIFLPGIVLAADGDGCTSDADCGDGTPVCADATTAAPLRCDLTDQHSSGMPGTCRYDYNADEDCTQLDSYECNGMETQKRYLGYCAAGTCQVSQDRYALSSCDPDNTNGDETCYIDDDVQEVREEVNRCDYNNPSQCIYDNKILDTCEQTKVPIGECLKDAWGGEAGPFSCYDENTIGKNYKVLKCLELSDSSAKCSYQVAETLPTNLECNSGPLNYTFNAWGRSCTLQVNYTGECFQLIPPCGVPSCKALSVNFTCSGMGGGGVSSYDGNVDCEADQYEYYDEKLNQTICLDDPEKPSSVCGPGKHSVCSDGACSCAVGEGKDQCDSVSKACSRKCTSDKHAECNAARGTCECVDGQDADNCASCGNCPIGQGNPYHTCVNGFCAQVNKCGTPNCTNCYGNPPWVCPIGQTRPHSVCSGSACIAVDDCGVTNCADCSPGGHTCPAGQTYPYTTCVDSTCVTVNACGSTNCADCLPAACPAGQTNPHTECINEACTAIYSCGPSSCAACNVDQCPAGQTSPHAECVNGACVAVEGCGAANCAACQDTFAPPQAANLFLSELFCTGVIGESMINLSWNYFDNGTNNTQTQFTIEVDNNKNFNNPVYTKVTNTSGPSNSQQIYIRLPNDVPGCNQGLENCYLTYGRAYYWRVKVKGNIGGQLVDSAWYYYNGNGNGGTTIQNNATTYTRTGKPAPYPLYSYTPNQPKVNQAVSFTDSSICFNNANNQVLCKNLSSSSYTWYFSNVSQSTTKGNVTYAFATPGNKTTTLSVCDGGLCCEYSDDFQVTGAQGNLPNYKEISPF